MLERIGKGCSEGGPRSDRKDTGMQEALRAGAEKANAKQTMYSIQPASPPRKHVKNQAQTKGESHVTGAGFYNKLAWLWPAEQQRIAKGKTQTRAWEGKKSGVIKLAISSMVCNTPAGHNIVYQQSRGREGRQTCNHQAI